MNTVKSQDDLNQPEKHSTDVLVAAIEKCKKLEKQLKIAIDGLKDIKSMTFERYLMANGWGAVNQMRKHAENTLNHIKESDK